MDYKLFEVGGKIRDEFLGLKSNDVDYSVVIDNQSLTLNEAYSEFVQQIKSEGFDVKIEHPDVVTVRAMFPKEHKYNGVADFVLARKELYYPETGRRPICKLGTLRDDLLRRDFTLNALAKGEDGEIVDLFNGYTDLMDNTLRTPGDPYKSFRDDPLRIIRAMRFCITKGFVLSQGLRTAIIEIGISGLEKVSIERVREELEKCFKYNTVKTLDYLFFFKLELNFDLIKYSFENTSLKLTPTNKK